MDKTFSDTYPTVLGCDSGKDKPSGTTLGFTIESRRALPIANENCQPSNSTLQALSTNSSFSNAPILSNCQSSHLLRKQQCNRVPDLHHFSSKSLTRCSTEDSIFEFLLFHCGDDALLASAGLLEICRDLNLNPVNVQNPRFLSSLPQPSQASHATSDESDRSCNARSVAPEPPLG